MKKVCLIDDDKEILHLLRQLIAKKGYYVADYQDSQEGIAAIENQHFDLLITDILMPEVDGIEVLRRAMKEKKDLKCIAISGGGSLIPVDYLAIVKTMGIKHAFTKPLNLPALEAAIDELLGA